MFPDVDGHALLFHIDEAKIELYDAATFYRIDGTRMRGAIAFSVRQKVKPNFLPG
jgi:hypothetical protein